MRTHSILATTLDTATMTTALATPAGADPITKYTPGNDKTSGVCTVTYNNNDEKAQLASFLRLRTAKISGYMPYLKAILTNAGLTEDVTEIPESQMVVLVMSLLLEDPEFDNLFQIPDENKKKAKEIYKQHKINGRDEINIKKIAERYKAVLLLSSFTNLKEGTNKLELTKEKALAIKRNFPSS